MVLVESVLGNPSLRGAFGSLHDLHEFTACVCPTSEMADAFPLSHGFVADVAVGLEVAPITRAGVPPGPTGWRYPWVGNIRHGKSIPKHALTESLGGTAYPPPACPSRRKNTFACSSPFVRLIRTMNDAPAVYRPRDPKATGWYRGVEDYFEEFVRVYDERFAAKFGFWRP